MTGVHLAKGGNNALGYRPPAGGAVTQLTSRATAVTLNKLCGQITTDDASLAAAAEATFTVNNNLVQAGDVVAISAQDQGATGEVVAFVTDVADGSFDITLANLHASTAATNAAIINFAVLKAVAE
jgi:hypothetical protein